MPEGSALLAVEGLACAYGRVEVLHGVSLTVGRGEIVALLGANGAGKTTLLRAISGLRRPTCGRMWFDGERLDAVPAHQRVGLGIAHAPEGRQVFGPLSVEDHLRLGAWRRGDAAECASVYDVFPALAERRRQAAGSLSGGQQQMLAIGRALMSRPRLLLLDEPSMGLAPNLVDQVIATIGELRARGFTILLVEQNVSAALSVADRAYVLEVGRVELEGPGPALLDDGRIVSAYLGL